MVHRVVAVVLSPALCCETLSSDRGGQVGGTENRGDYRMHACLVIIDTPQLLPQPSSTSCDRTLILVWKLEAGRIHEKQQAVTAGLARGRFSYITIVNT